MKAADTPLGELVCVVFSACYCYVAESMNEDADALEGLDQELAMASQDGENDGKPTPPFVLLQDATVSSLSTQTCNQREFAYMSFSGYWRMEFVRCGPRTGGT